MEHVLGTMSGTRRQAFIALQIVGGVTIFVTAVWETNLTPFLAAVAAALWFRRCWVRSEANQGYHFNFWARFDRKTFFSSLFECWRVVTGPLVVIALTSFVYVPMPFWAQHVIDKGDGRVSYVYGEFNVNLVIPWIHSVHNFHRSQTPTNYGEPTCHAYTLDGKPVQAMVWPTLQLPFDRLPVAYAAAGSQSKLSKLTEAEFCSRFAAVVHQYTAAVFPSILTIETGTVDVKTGMNKLGVLYSGPIEVQNIHAVADQRN